MPPPGIATRIIPLCLIALLGVMLAACDDAPQQADSEEQQRTPVAAVEMEPRDLSRRLSVSAAVQPRVQIRLASRANGTLDEVGPEIGDRVEAGDVMARLDVSEEQAELARARAQERDARSQYERTRELNDQGVASAAQLQRDEAAVLVAESERRVWESRVAFGRVEAPRDAVVTARYVEPGEAVDARQTLFELAVMDELVMRPGVSEREVVHLSPGMAVPIRLDAMPGRALTGEVRRIFPMASHDSRLVTVEVSLPADAAAEGVRPGFLGRIRMAVDRREDVLAVPADAISDRDGRQFVFVIEDERLVEREVEPDTARGEWTIIREGLEAGDVVLASNPGDLQDGDAVRIVTWRD
ncbi:efflux RND transporter periplasmic adaptor subunit [Aquisalimonas asiatica]|uniref:RND family efflux transporter, MFP subunit n=1 Tax=Aquisalimonas asiatica TaxID=406100 RepID=A0A1H8SAR5_9GAMM|nr:efflux RND transporter periplasmic adaptor subunit [Aquisalimonas asiatica]SEO75741.1 RND family efflux transporter, MFP subunit [Aquisalimonas asiatica]